MPMTSRFPTLYEINTWVWLSELAKKTGAFVDLRSIPPAEWDALAAFGFDAVWLMGVWERSPAGIQIANQNENLLADFQQALPDFRFEDNVGSPYCVRNYVVNPHLGGPEGLARARQELARRGMGLVLDFVPNHVAPDHPWVREHPEYFLRGTAEDLRRDPDSFLPVNNIVYACGKDPYFPAWPDVLQLNAFEPGLRRAAVETLTALAEQSDGVRCDMAMLVLNSVFERTWGSRAGSRPGGEYWADVISAIKRAYPNFRFIAEAYWDLEWELQLQGFDFCYDKRLYDRLEHDSAETVRLHLTAGLDYQARLLRFIENHDEPRAAASFSSSKQRAAAVVSSTLPGARLFHEGQFEGRKVRLPVFLGRRPEEQIDREVQEFYKTLLAALDRPLFRAGQWQLCDRQGWPDNRSFENIVAWCWRMGEERTLIVVNLSSSPAQAMIRPSWDDPGGRTWRPVDRLSGRAFERSGDEMLARGLYVDLVPWGYHFLDFL